MTEQGASLDSCYHSKTVHPCFVATARPLKLINLFEDRQSTPERTLSWLPLCTVAFSTLLLFFHSCLASHPLICLGHRILIRLCTFLRHGGRNPSCWSNPMDLWCCLFSVAPPVLLLRDLGDPGWGDPCFRMVLCCFSHLCVWVGVCLFSACFFICFLVVLAILGCDDTCTGPSQFSFVALNSRWQGTLICNYCSCNVIQCGKRPGESHEGVGREKNRFVASLFPYRRTQIWPGDLRVVAVAVFLVLWVVPWFASFVKPKGCILFVDFYTASLTVRTEP